MVGEFNRVQRECGRGGCSNGSYHNWLEAIRPKVAICPHREDYCDTCSKSKIKIHSKQTTINRLLHSCNASPEEIENLQDELKDLKQAHEDHKDEAEKSHSYYIKVTNQCATEWEEVVLLEKKERLTRAEKLK